VRWEPEECSPLVGLGAALLVCLSVFLGADLLSVLVGYQSRIPPEPLVASPVAVAGPSTSAAPDLAILKPVSLPVSSGSPAPSPSGGATDPSIEPMEPGGESASIDLQGVMLGGGVGVAVLEVGGREYTATVGEQVGSYQLVEIHPDRVVLGRDGQTFPVRLSGSPVTQPVGDGPPVLPDPGEVPLPPPPAPAAAGPALPPDMPASQAQALTVPTPEATSVSRQEIDAFLEQGAMLARDVRGVAVPGDGRGVRLEFRNPANALARLGLRDGDVVLSLNGESIRTPEELYNSYLILRNTPTVDFRVLRGGQPTAVHHDFSDE